MKTVRLTMAQALVRYLCAQYVEIDGQSVPMFAGVWAIFGHGNVAALGEALQRARQELPTYRGQNEQGMALAAVAYAKAQRRQRMMAVTTSIGPGALNMVTACAVAHVNRLPLLLLPGDTFATRAPDPVLQQIENYGDPTISANDCFRPVSRYWDRITRPEQIIKSLRRAMQVLTDPVDCGPVTLSIPQDVQAEAYDYPENMFEKHVRRFRRPEPDAAELAEAVELLKNAKKPLIVAGGGVLYSDACADLAAFAQTHGIPVGETQAGKGSLAWNHPFNAGAIGHTGSAAANDLAAEADVVLAVGTRLSDFTTASRTVFGKPDAALISLNTAPFDTVKWDGAPLVADARQGLRALGAALDGWRSPASWQAAVTEKAEAWNRVIDAATAPTNADLPTDAQVLGAVNRASGDDDVVVNAAGGLPGELHKLWRTAKPGGYHLEYGFSCMGYEIAGGLGVRLARGAGEVFVMVGDGSYLMMNSELAGAVMLGQKLIVVLLDNGGFGCINRLQRACGGESFNNLLRDALQGPDFQGVDFTAHMRALGLVTEKVTGIAGLEKALERAKASPKSYGIVIDTDPMPTTREGGAWWEVAVPEVSPRREVAEARERYLSAKKRQVE
jgi:3D-(3,5/4)-trihydroxycyclohexane-1,2-dione acylhydrolase (decyclizing)